MKQPEKYPAHERISRLVADFANDEHGLSLSADFEKMLVQEFNSLIADRQADEKLIRELLNILMISEPICWRNENIVSRHQHAIARAQTRLGGEAPFETDNQKLIEDM